MPGGNMLRFVRLRSATWPGWSASIRLSTDLTFLGDAFGRTIRGSDLIFELAISCRQLLGHFVQTGLRMCHSIRIRLELHALTDNEFMHSANPLQDGGSAT